MGYKNDDKCINKAYEDERLFVLMARDPAAVDAVIQWIGVSVAMQPAEKLHEALDCAIEMSKRCDEFRKRKEEDEKKEIEMRDREDFERYKKRRDGKGPIMDFPSNNEHKVGNYEEALRAKETPREVVLLQSFANYLDSMGKSQKIDYAHKTAHGFADLVNDFIKSLATPVR